MIFIKSASVAIAAIAAPLGSTNGPSVSSSIAPTSAPIPTSDASGSTVRPIKNPSLPGTLVNPTPTTSVPNPAMPSNSVSDFTTLSANAQRGDPQAELEISVDYYMGKGVPQDYQKAYEWNLESAILGNARRLLFGQSSYLQNPEGRNPVRLSLAFIFFGLGDFVEYFTAGRLPGGFGRGRSWED